MPDKQQQRPWDRARSSVDNAVCRSPVRLRRQRDRRFQPNDLGIRGLNRRQPRRGQRTGRPLVHDFRRRRLRRRCRMGPVRRGRRCRKHLLFENRKLCYSAESDNTKEPQLGRQATGCPRKTKFFIWIRCNPLKSPESAKGIQGNTSNLIWICLLFVWRMRSKSGKIGR